MELKNIDQIEEGMIVFMPSGIQATLHKMDEDIVVEYPELYQDKYSKEEFEAIINEGIIIFNEPGVIMEAYNQEDCPEGSVKQAMDNKEFEIVTTEFKNEALTALTKLAKEFPDGHVRQQALTFMDELGLQEYYDLEAVRKFIKEYTEKLAEFNTVNESLNEEEGPLKDKIEMEVIAKELTRGEKAGKTGDLGNWICETSLDEKWEAMTQDIKDYILEVISYPVADGHIRYYDLDTIFVTASWTKEDLMSLDLFTEEEIDEAIAKDGELETWIEYEIKFDGELEEAFKEKKEDKKKKLDEVNKDGKMNEDCYKVYNSLCPECDPVSLNSWNEVEEYLNKVWGDYKADRCKENNEFGSEQDREEFMGSFDVAIVEPLEVIEAPVVVEEPIVVEPVEVVEEPADLTAEEVEEIKQEVEDCLDQLEDEVEAKEETNEDYTTDKLEKALETMNGEKLANLLTKAAEDMVGPKKAKAILIQFLMYIDNPELLNEDFVDNMGLTDVNDLDMPDALKASIPVTKEGEVLTPDKYAQEIENLKQLVMSVKKDLLSELKQEIKLALSDMKQDIKTDVNDVENKVDDTKDAVDNLAVEAELAAEEDFEALEEPEQTEEEQVEESYVNPFKPFMKKGLMEDLVKVKTEVDKLITQGKSAEDVKNTITLLSDNEKEQEEASKYALDKMKESLLRHSQNATLAGIATVEHGLTLK